MGGSKEKGSESKGEMQVVRGRHGGKRGIEKEGGRERASERV